MASDRNLAELADLNVRDATCEMARWSAAPEMMETADVLMAAGPPDLPLGYANAAFPIGEGEPEAPERIVQRAYEFFAHRRRRYTLWTRARGHEALKRAAQAAGLQRNLDMPGLVLEAPLAENAPPRGAVLEVVEDEDQARVFVAVTLKAYAGFFPPSAAAGIFARPDRLLRPHVLALVARVGGEAVSAALAVFSHGIAGIYWVGTIEACRGRGLGEACTRAVGNAAFARGASAVVLQATRQAEPMYKRMGYREITRYTWYVDLRPGA